MFGSLSIYGLFEVMTREWVESWVSPGVEYQHREIEQPAKVN